MKTTLAFFAAQRYWSEENALREAYDGLSGQLQFASAACRLLVDGEGVEDLPRGEGHTLVIVPMSGAVQKDILQAAEAQEAVVLYAAYIDGNAPRRLTDSMLENNAAPTLMDSWSVLRKRHPNVQLALNEGELAQKLRILAAYGRVRGSRLLLIGEPEPWVISVSRNLEDYQRVGIEIRQIPQQEAADLYAVTTEAEGQPYFEKYRDGARACQEPTEQALKDAGRMTAALLKLLDAHQADGLAIACFNLLSLGTTSCLGVSYINDCTDKVAACEGDLDSALTMLMLKPLARTKLWMANPGLHPEGVVNFSHCTAPLAIDGAQDQPYALRNHHESGIGVSLEVELPSERRVTACRVAGAWGTFTAQEATAYGGPREPCCRTQLYIRFDDFDRYIRTALGCHQVFCFEELAAEFSALARMLGMKPEPVEA